LPLFTIMIFGTPSDFAIEAYHEPSGPEWGGCGRLCLYIRGVPVGDLRDNHCSLLAVTDCFREFADKIETLWSAHFAGLSDAEVFRLIDRARYSDEPSSGLGSDFAAFDFLTNSAEMFDNIKTFIFCEPGGVVHILYRLPDDSFGSGTCSVESFRSVVAQYAHWFDEQVRTTAPPYFPINPFDLNEKVPGDEKG